MSTPSRRLLGSRLALGLALAALACAPPADATTETWTDTSWTSTIYYRGDFRAPAATQGTIWVSAVDRYDLSINGTAIGSGSEWADAESYPISLKSGKNEVLVRVVNQGLGHGSGLMVEIEADSLHLASSTGNGPIAWRWTTEDPSTANWSKAPFVQLGDLGNNRVTGFPDSLAAAIAAYPGDIDPGSPGGVAISRVEGANLALNQPASRIEITDGLRETAWQPGANALNKFVSIDLGQKRLINRVRVLTTPPRVGGLFADNSLKGYSVQISEDQFRWSEIGVLHGITEYEASEITLVPIFVRYLRLVVAEIDGISSPQVGEIEVYGEGFHSEGILTSEVLDMGTPTLLKNFGRVSWAADTPEGTQVEFRLRTSRDNQSWSEWSDPVSASDGLFLTPEPAAYLQYRAYLRTDDEHQSPRLHSVAVDYSRDEMAASSARASIEPNRVPMGADTIFVYHLDIVPNQGVGKLQMLTPGNMTFLGVDGYSGQLTEDAREGSLALLFDPPLTTDVDVRLAGALYAPTHTFNSFLYSPGSENPLNVEPAARGALSVYVDQVLAATLLDVEVSPRVFSPNGDNVNDFAVIEYSIAKVSAEVGVTVRVFDLTGRTVRTLFDGGQLPRRYGRVARSDELTRSAPGFWDGTDETGRLVPPGLYLYEVEAATGDGTAKKVGTVGVAY